MFILDFRNDIRQEANSSFFFFFFEYKMGHKAAATTHNTNSTFGPEIANKCTVQR